MAISNAFCISIGSAGALHHFGDGVYNLRHAGLAGGLSSSKMLVDKTLDKTEQQCMEQLS